jgi:hypothetical protein|uniref:Uncharacterized protein n=1 Tax=viral metagenome TaxID=1070528 RepID=A0A6C0LEU8_9ZZZZ
MSSAFLKEYGFLKNFLQYYMNLLQNAPSGNNGGNLTTPIQFDAKASLIDNVLLDIEGIVAYIYYQAFNIIMPSIRGNVTQIEADNIYSIYDALGATRPILNIV